MDPEVGCSKLRSQISFGLPRVRSSSHFQDIIVGVSGGDPEPNEAASGDPTKPLHKPGVP